MYLTGQSLIGDRAYPGAGLEFRAIDPSTRAALEPPFFTAAADVVDAACRLADDAFDEYRSTSADARAALLETIARNIEALAGC